MDLKLRDDGAVMRIGLRLVGAEGGPPAGAPSRRDRHEPLEVVRAQAPGDRDGGPGLPVPVGPRRCGTQALRGASGGRAAHADRGQGPARGRVKAAAIAAGQLLVRLRGRLRALGGRRRRPARFSRPHRRDSVTGSSARTRPWIPAMRPASPGTGTGTVDFAELLVNGPHELPHERSPLHLVVLRHARQLRAEPVALAL